MCGFFLCVQLCSKPSDLSLDTRCHGDGLRVLGAHHVLSNRIHQLANTRVDRLGIDPKRGCDVSMTQVSLHACHAAVALGVRCERSPEYLEIDWHRNPQCMSNRLDPPAEPIFRTHGRSPLARE